eukprot:6405663-Pyramimonas_sp.AAC.1
MAFAAVNTTGAVGTTMLAARIRTPGERARGRSTLVQKTPHTKLRVNYPTQPAVPRWRCRDAVGPSELSEITSTNVEWTNQEVEQMLHDVTAQGSVQNIEPPSAEEKAVPFGPVPLDISPSVGSKLKVYKRASTAGTMAW